MKLQELCEMTWRTKMDMSNMPFPKFPEDSSFEGKMSDGYEVFSFKYENTIIFGVKLDDRYISFLQVTKNNVNNYGSVYEILNTKVEKDFLGNTLLFKMIQFLNMHFGYSVLLGSIHSINTVKVLKKVESLFDVKIINIITGEIIPFTYEDYLKQTSEKEKTDWQVLFEGNGKGLKEDACFMGWAGVEHENRHLWTYGTWPKNLEDLQ